MASTDAHDLQGPALYEVEGLAGNYSASEHIQVPINGVLTDIIVERGTNGVEFWKIDANTGEPTLISSDYLGINKTQSYHPSDIYEVNGEWYMFASYDSYAGQTPGTTLTSDPETNITYKLDQTTGEWNVIQQQTTADLVTSVTNRFQFAARAEQEIFVGDDGNTYMWFIKGSGYQNKAENYAMEKLVWDPATESWGPTGVSFDQSSPANFAAETGLAYPLVNNTGFEIIETSDGMKMIMAGGQSGAATAADDYFTVLDLDGNGNPTGTFTTFKPSDFVYASSAADQFLKDIRVDPNGNIVMVGGQAGTSEGGIIVLDPTGTQVVASYGIGNGNLDGNTNKVGYIGRDADVVFQDGYMYITSESAWNYTPKPYNIIIDTSDYSIVDQGFDPDGGHATMGSSSLKYITTVSGETFMIEYGRQDTGGKWQMTVAQTTVSGGGGGGGAICFAKGTKIRTAWGEIPVEDLMIGDLVETMDHGQQEIRWIGRRKLDASGHLAPVLFKAGAIGNARDLVVSPQHRMLLQNWRAELIFNSNKVLVAAKDLVNDKDILRLPMEEVEYFHILFDNHEIVFAESVPSESFHPGVYGLKVVDSEQREELLSIFPELEFSTESFGQTAYPSLNKHEVRALM